MVVPFVLFKAVSKVGVGAQTMFPFKRLFKRNMGKLAGRLLGAITKEKGPNRANTWGYTPTHKKQASFAVLPGNKGIVRRKQLETEQTVHEAVVVPESTSVLQKEQIRNILVCCDFPFRVQIRTRPPNKAKGIVTAERFRGLCTDCTAGSCSVRAECWWYSSGNLGDQSWNLRL